jgi:hypothetical protein
LPRDTLLATRDALQCPTEIKRRGINICESSNGTLR